MYIHKNLFLPQKPDLLEKFGDSLLYNFHREHIFAKIEDKKSYCEKIVLKI